MIENSGHIRDVQTGDFEAIWRLHNLALIGTGAHAGNGDWDNDVRDPIGSYVALGGRFLVCEVDKTIVGMGAYLPIGGGSIEVKRMRVDPSHQGTGIARRVLAALEQNAKGDGFSRAILETTRQQKPAQVLYERNGYVRTHESTFGGYEIIHYEKAL